MTTTVDAYLSNLSNTKRVFRPKRKTIKVSGAKTVDTPHHLGQSKKGDTVLLCLDNVPKGCPPGDDRGKSFIAINERNNIMFKVVKGHHFCGGA